jgi:hypothetical protein
MFITVPAYGYSLIRAAVKKTSYHPSIAGKVSALRGKYVVVWLLLELAKIWATGERTANASGGGYVRIIFVYKTQGHKMVGFYFFPQKIIVHKKHYMHFWQHLLYFPGSNIDAGDA